MAQCRARVSFTHIFLAGLVATTGAAFPDRDGSAKTISSSAADLAAREMALPDKMTFAFMASDVSGGGVVDLTWASDFSPTIVSTALDGTANSNSLVTITKTITVLATDSRGTIIEPDHPDVTPAPVSDVYTRTVTVTVTTRTNADSSATDVAGITRSLLDPFLKTRTLTTIVTTNASASVISYPSSILPTIPLSTGSQIPLASNACGLANSTAYWAGTGTNLSRGWATGACSSWWASDNDTYLASAKWTPVTRTYVTYVWNTPTAAPVASMFLSSAPRSVPNDLIWHLALFQTLAPMLLSYLTIRVST